MDTDTQLAHDNARRNADTLQRIRELRRLVHLLRINPPDGLIANAQHLAVVDRLVADANQLERGLS